MGYKEVSRVDIVEVIRRWQTGISLRHIATGTGLSRDTVRKYVAAAKGEGVDHRGPAPTEEQLSRLAAVGRSGPRTAATPAEDLLAPWSDQIYRWLNTPDTRHHQASAIGRLSCRGAPSPRLLGWRALRG